MILKFKQKLCGKGLPMVDLNGEGYSEWDCFDGMIEYSIDFDVREYGVKDIIPFVDTFRVHIEEMDGDKTETISLNWKDGWARMQYKNGARRWSMEEDDNDNGGKYSESWTQLGDAIVNGLNINHITLNTDTKDIEVCMR